MKKILGIVAVLGLTAYLAVNSQNENKTTEEGAKKEEKSLVSSLTSGAANLVNKAEEGVKNVAEKAGEATEKAAEAAKDATNAAADKVKDVAAKADEATGGVATGAIAGVTGMADKATEAAGNAVDSAKETATEATKEATDATSSAIDSAKNVVNSVAGSVAVVGKAAPAINAATIDGGNFDLAANKGKVVVIEWTNLDCPFVKKHYSTNNMQNLQKKYTAAGVVWVSVVSSAKDKQGYFADNATATAAFEKAGSNASEVILDAAGTVGKNYQAKTTPHMFVVNKEGVLAYAGAIDSVSSADSSDVSGATNYVANAIDELLAGKPVTKASTSSYGCSVKY